MPQQTKTEALEEIARKMRRDILDGTAPLDGVWWWTDDVKMQDRIAHVLLDYDRDDEPTLRKQLIEMESLLASARHSRDEAVRACAQLRESNVALIGDRNDWRVKALALAPILADEAQGPWVVYDPADSVGEPFRFQFGWVKSCDSKDDAPFKDEGSTRCWIETCGNARYLAIPMTAARAIEAAKAGGQ
jgi:hypothetical protein